jgi:F0F1-type ATP synthase membrane subunit b/b'
MKKSIMETSKNSGRVFGSSIIFLLILGFIMAACAKPPVEEMNRAQDAVIRAENDAEAAAYAGNTLDRAREALVKMQSEAGAKRFEAAKDYAAQAVSEAEKAITDGKTGAVRAREEAANLIDSLPGPLAETAHALEAARKVQNIKLDFNALSNDMDTARRGYDEARESLLAGKYREAIARGQNVRSLLFGINARMSEAAQAESRKK